MSAETLRRAAALMRKRAEAAYEGPWSTDGPWWHNPEDEAVDMVTASPGRMAVAIAPPLAFVTADDDRRRESMTHIATWHPALAVAVADWLDYEAGVCERADANYPALAPQPADERALAVANAYLAPTP